MATENLISDEEDERTLNSAGNEQSDEETDSGSESEEEVAVPLVPPKKPKSITITPQKPFENGNGSACSSPSVSAFMIMPSLKSSTDNNKKDSASKLKVFSDEDVIAMLKGLARFWINGKNNKWAEFHHFIKDDLQTQFTKSQVSEKVRSLKKRFLINSARAWENGGRLDLSDPHEWTVFELSKDLWGDETAIVQEKRQMSENEDEEADEIVGETKLVSENAEGGNNNVKKGKRVNENDEGSKSKKKHKQLGEHDEVNKKARKILFEEGEKEDAANTTLSMNQHDENEGNSDEEDNIPADQKQEMKISYDSFQSEFPLLWDSFDIFRFPMVAKENCHLIGRENAQELEYKWRELNAELHHLELKKLDLLKRSDFQGRR